MSKKSLISVEVKCSRSFVLLSPSGLFSFFQIWLRMRAFCFFFRAFPPSSPLLSTETESVDDSLLLELEGLDSESELSLEEDEDEDDVHFFFLGFFGLCFGCFFFLFLSPSLLFFLRFLVIPPCGSWFSLLFMEDVAPSPTLWSGRPA